MIPVVYKRQRQILDFLNSYIEKFGQAPTLVEIAKKFKLKSLATVHEHLQTLEKKGLIKKQSGLSRGIEIIDRKISMPMDNPDCFLIRPFFSNVCKCS